MANPTTEPIDHEEEEVEEVETKKKGICPTGEEAKLFCCDPNGAGEGVFTCMCHITPGNWAIILTLFAVYYAFLAMFFWGLIEAMFEIKDQGTPDKAHATD
ncbi:hypothetical protein DIPPA_19354 [Diplonema papillatum]|nr:hypothetical protein DIPPA_19354 [Diplonema papillatum]